MRTQELTRTESRARPTESTVKSVLVYIHNEATAAERLEAALSVARSTSAHVTCLQVTPIEAYVAFDGFGGVFAMTDVMKAIDEEAIRLRELVAKELANEDVSWDYVQETGNVAGEIARYAALADLVVIGREPPRVQFGVPMITLMGDLLERCRTPLHVPGSTAIDPTGPAVIAWNGSYEAANAVRTSLGLLKMASQVRVVRVTDQPQKEGAFPGMRLMEYLSRHGIHAELVVEASPAASDDDFVSASLISNARSLGGYVLMGGYSRSRVSEFLFGGVTRTMIADSTIPLVIAR